MGSAALRSVRWWAGPLLLAAIVPAVDAILHRIPFMFWIYGGLDWAGHLSTAALGLLVLARFIDAPRRFYVVAMIASVAIDLDKMPRFLGLVANEVYRPLPHSLITVAVCVAAAAAIRRYRAVLAGVATGVVFHFARDVAVGHPGVRVLWPFQETSWMISYWWYLGTIVGLTAARLALVSTGLPRTRIPFFRTPSPSGRGHRAWAQ